MLAFVFHWQPSELRSLDLEEIPKWIEEASQIQRQIANAGAEGSD